MSVLLLVGAGLFVRSLSNVRALDLGWNPEPVLVVTPNYRGLQLDSVAADATRRAMLDAARAIPGVASAARVNSQPFATSYHNLFVAGIDSVQRLGRFNYQATTPQYFDVSGTRIVRGRGFNDQERGQAGNVAVVSQSMARTLWPNAEPLGQCFRIASETAPCMRVIGVAEDVVQQTIFDNEKLIYYIPDEGPAARPGNRLWIRLARSDATSQIEAVRRALQVVMPAPGYVTMFVGFGALAGVVLGMIGALGAAHWVAPLLFGEDARDLLVYLVVAMTIGVVTLVASAAPALRATRADPNAALRAS